MPSAHLIVESDVERSARVMQLEGIFDIPPTQRIKQSWDVTLPLEDQKWNIGLIVGPSGSGKTTLLNQIFGKQMRVKYEWKKGASVVDSFPKNLSIKDIVELLSSVGFSSPPSWLKSYHVLSTGEQFRVSLARVLSETKNDIAICDEFTSTVDRTVAQIGSCAAARTVRRLDRQLIVATCHEDIEEWLQPDWVYRIAENAFKWRSLQRRPEITLSIVRVHHSAWTVFRHHHYLDTSLNRSATCFAAIYRKRPVAFSAWLAAQSGYLSGRREHRTVTLPDFQGVGIGNALSESCASMWRALHKRAFSTTSHPAMIAHRLRSDKWKCVRHPSLCSVDGSNSSLKHAVSRLTAGFEYSGPAMNSEQARHLLETTLV